MSLCLIILSLLLWSCFSSSQSTTSGSVAPWPTQSFRTAPSFRPPVFNVSKSGAPLAPGLLLTTLLPVTNEIENAAVIMTDAGDLVWNSPPGSLSNLRVQSLDSQPVLSYWNGASVGYQGYGYISVLDTTYTEIYRVCPQINVLAPGNTTFPCSVDIHESSISPRGTMLLTVYNVTTADLTSVNGPKTGYIYDNLFYELDIKTNKTLFRWSALEAGIPLSKTKAPFAEAGFGNGTLDSPFDWFHINSVQLVGSKYLINSRHIWNTYLLTDDGQIEWEIEGYTGGDFRLPEGGQFSWQHDARIQNATETDALLTYFNNANGNAPLFNGSSPAEGLEFHLNLVDKTATLLNNLVDSDELIYPIAAGSTTKFPNGNTLLGYGTYPSIKEFGPDGDVRMSIRHGVIGDANPAGFTSLSYRAFRQEWVGTPAVPPVAVVDSDTNFMYVSWNGATGITKWEILCGNSTGQDEATLASVQSKGFETMFDLSGRNCTSSVQAVAYRDDIPLSSSNAVILTA